MRSGPDILSFWYRGQLNRLCNLSSINLVQLEVWCSKGSTLSGTGYVGVRQMLWYCIAYECLVEENVGGITGGLPNFTIQILTMSCDIKKANKQECFTSQKLLMAKVFLHQTFMLYGI